MRAVDTNVLVRLLTRDDAKAMTAAESFVTAGAWVSHVVLAETLWVLESVYKLNAEQRAAAVGMLLHHATVTLQDPDVVTAALAHFRRKPLLGFSDCLVLEIARRAGHLPLGTFDRRLGKLDGTQRLRGDRADGTERHAYPGRSGGTGSRELRRPAVKSRAPQPS